MNILNDWLLEWGFPTEAIAPTVFVANIAFVVVIAFLANFITKKGIIRVIDALIVRSRVRVLLLLKRHRVLLKFSHIAPAIVFYRLTPVLFTEWPLFIEAVRVSVGVYLVIVAVLVIDSILNVFLSAFSEVERTRDLPLKGLVQAIKLVVILLGTILAAAVVLGKSPMILMSGLGALTAVLLLVFKDAILGFVAGIQLSANNMVQIGDWIEMPKQNADGDVIDVSLTTVKVQNWDKTITTIPSYLLISDSFRNWRGMSESGGRRVKRAINIDVRSIRFLDEELLKRCESIHLLR
ncbi:MAG TPA: mechanosensitive ion channel domain-containing protein, partial [Opitutales bacterium]|nr:mechanosensitive ion channel domain-containing protein [Opitutales bacterium]